MGSRTCESANGMSPQIHRELRKLAVTREAADRLADCFRQLIRRDVPRDTAQRFILQMLVAFFAEDIDLLPKYFVTQVDAGAE